MANLGDIYPAQWLVDGVDNPVDVWFVAVEKMMERSILRSGYAASRHTLKAEDSGFQSDKPDRCVMRGLSLLFFVMVTQVTHSLRREPNLVCHTLRAVGRRPGGRENVALGYLAEALLQVAGELRFCGAC